MGVAEEVRNYAISHLTAQLLRVTDTAHRDHSSARGDGDRKVAEGTLKGIKADGVLGPMSEAIKLNFENRVREGSHAAVLVRVNVRPKLGTVATIARRFDHEFALRTRLTLVACHRPALAGMSSALRRSAIVS